MTKAESKKERCRLQEANGIEAWCTRDKCIYWRLLEAQEVDVSNEQGCGLKHFGVFERLDKEMAQWLLTMKRRLENTTPEFGRARINFRRREQKK
jgi:hypothetical protein